MRGGPRITSERTLQCWLQKFAWADVNLDDQLEPGRLSLPDSECLWAAVKVYFYSGFMKYNWG